MSATPGEVSSQGEAAMAALLGKAADTEGGQGEPDESATANQDGTQPLPGDQAGAADQDQGDQDQGDADDQEELELGLGEPTDAAPIEGSLAELAANAGVKAADLYKLTIPMGGGAEPLTLGQLKDQAVAVGDLEAGTDGLALERTNFENERLRAQQEIQELVKLLPSVPQTLVDQARQALTDSKAQEHEALLRVKPEWADEALFAQAKQETLAAVTDYGFTQADLDGVSDHRLTKLLHDFATMRKRIERSHAKGKELRQGQQRQGRQVTEGQRQRAGAAAKRKQAKSGTTEQKTQAVADILRGAT